MKEQEQNINQNELTNQANSTNLGNEGNIFMSGEPGNTEDPRPQGPEPSSNPGSDGGATHHGEPGGDNGGHSDGPSNSKDTAEGPAGDGAEDGTGGAPFEADESGTGKDSKTGASSSDDSTRDSGDSGNKTPLEEMQRLLRLEQKRKSREAQDKREARAKELIEEWKSGTKTAEEAAQMYMNEYGNITGEDAAREAGRRMEHPVSNLIREASEEISITENVAEAGEMFNQIRTYVKHILSDIDKGLFVLETKGDSDQAKAAALWLTKAREFESNEKLGNPVYSLKDYQDLAKDLTRGRFLSELITKNSEERTEVRELTQPQSLEDLVRLIINSEDPKWGTNGETPLIKEGVIQKENLLDWVRSKILYHHEFTADGEIHLFQDIYIATPYRQIGLGEIITESSRYFRKEKEKGVYVHDEEYVHLKDEMLYEVWLFENNHNYGAKYRATMGQEEKCIETLMAIHFQNIFSLNKDRLYRIMTMPSANKQETDRAIAGERERGSVGKGFRQAELAYNYLYEIGLEAQVADQFNGGENMFEKALGKDGSLAFYKGIFEKLITDKYGNHFKAELEAYKEAVKGLTLDQRVGELDFLTFMLKRKPDFAAVINSEYTQYRGDPNPSNAININIDPTLTSDLGHVRKLTEDLLIKTYAVSKKEGLSDLNIYTKFANARYKQDLLTAGMANAVGHNYKLTQQDAKYADAWAFPMTYWTGLSARNDTAVHFSDSLSRIMNFELRQLKEESGRSGGGDKELMGGIQKLAFTMWEGLRVTDEKTGKEKTLLEVLQGGQGDKVDLESDLPVFKFSDSSQQSMLAAQHYSNGYTLYKFLMDKHGFDFDKNLGRDQHGRLVVNPELRKVVRDEWLKALRYTFDMGGYYYNRSVRGWSRVSANERDVPPIIETKSFGEFTFDEKVLLMNMYDRRVENGRTIKAINDAWKKEDDGSEHLREMSRNIAAFTFAREMWKHRNESSGYRLYSAWEFDNVEEYLRSLPLEVEMTNMGAMNTVNYFSRKEAQKIREVGHVERGKLLRQSDLYTTASGLGSSFWDMLQEFVKKF